MQLRSLAHNVRIQVSHNAPYNPEFPNSNGYMVKLSYQRRSMTVPFYMGYAYTEEPTALVVMKCLISDALTVENAQDFEDWCRELGYDPDSRKAEKIYKQAVQQTNKLKRLLGEDYQQFIESELG